MWIEVSGVPDNILWDYLKKKRESKDVLDSFVREWPGLYKMPKVGENEDGSPHFELQDVLRIFGVPHDGKYYCFHAWMREKKIVKVERELRLGCEFGKLKRLIKDLKKTYG